MITINADSHRGVWVVLEQVEVNVDAHLLKSFFDDVDRIGLDVGRLEAIAVDHEELARCVLAASGVEGIDVMVEARIIQEVLGVHLPPATRAIIR